MAVAARALTLPAVVEELLSEMAAAARDGAPIPDEHLLSLKFVFGSSAIQALDLVDRQSVTLISSPSGRRVYQVLGSSGRTYVCLASCHYCSCPAFAFSVLRKGDSLLVRMGRAPPPTAAELGERLRALVASFKSCTKWGFYYMWKQIVVSSL
ncbi:zinc finger SWIM domain-containing protein 7 isoform X1 [Neophocaena asiaeorientalis asiaeorientalis]|uniref:Zinc finger SWIM domain-containing protein 7 isoform X1 n=1 Tax=Neophocaena asiaeorientalis asiaeorientalis TaxID=1706337 RepID=A0A341C491_NEOAA|nr:zinc finger SWIM domain-containing protein 7 isoform X1 [Neophocaena asiaeorientalis asiaeorientalis]